MPRCASSRYAARGIPLLRAYAHTVPDAAAASMRRSCSSATPFARVAASAPRRRRRASVEDRSATRGNSASASRSRRNCSRTLDEDLHRRCGSAARRWSGRGCTWAMDAASSPCRNWVPAPPPACRTLPPPRRGLGLRERRQAVPAVFQRACDLHADNVGPRRQHLAQLDIARPQFFQRVRPGAHRHPACAHGTPTPGRQQPSGMDQTVRNCQLRSSRPAARPTAWQRSRPTDCAPSPAPAPLRRSWRRFRLGRSTADAVAL